MDREARREAAVDASQQSLRDIAVSIEQVKTKLAGMELDLFAVKNAMAQWTPTVDLARDIFAAGKVARWIVVAIIGSSLALYAAWEPVARVAIKLFGK